MNYQRLAMAPGAVATLLLLAAGTAAAAQTSRILHHDALVIDWAAAGDGGLPVAAFGEHWRLRLEDNPRIGQRRNLRDIRVLGGSIDGRPGSWLRLTRAGKELTGILFDGETLYGIEPRRQAAPRLQHPDTGPGTVNVIFRMRDLVLPPAADGCELLPPASAGSGAGSVARLAAETAALPADGGRRMLLDVVADYEFFRMQAAGAEAAILARLNIVDGIFLNQLGIDIEIDSLQIFGTANDPFTSRVPAELLDELRRYRLASGFTRGPTHLLTGRDLAGTTRGIAYFGAACSTEFGAALSQQTADTWISALTTAHEIGHTLGAWHDNESSQMNGQRNPCEFAPPGFLMEATINGNDRFSQCSLDTIERFLASGAPEAACVAGISTSAAGGEDSDAGGGGGSLGLPDVAAMLALMAMACRRSNQAGLAA